LKTCFSFPDDGFLRGRGTTKMTIIRPNINIGLNVKNFLRRREIGGG
jgi:hypothetical protein